jgi:nucleoside-diphosphate-sugar epimerase
MPAGTGQSKRMKILITGSTGHLGEALLPRIERAAMG